MASLDAFLADLDELQDEEEEHVDDEEGGEMGDDDDDLDMTRDDRGDASRGAGTLLTSAKMTVRRSRQVQMMMSRKAAGLSLNEKLESAFIMSSSEKVLNEIDVSSASSSSGDVGMPIPPKSVKWLQSQWSRPSGPLGGGACTHGTPAQHSAEQ